MHIVFLTEGAQPPFSGLQGTLAACGSLCFLKTVEKIICNSRPHQTIIFKSPMNFGIVYFSLGSNLGDRAQSIALAIEEISIHIGRVNKISSMFESEPIGDKSHPKYLNCCISAFSGLTPNQIMQKCHEIEMKLGRVRGDTKWAPRTIDIDIIFCGDKVVSTPILTVPHPEAHKRLFVLMPMAELAPDFTHPKLRKSVWQLLNECPDTSIVSRPSHGEA